ncbi:MAG: TonB-dependent receptor [Sandaracinaceae bacterium]|nr:TonB-dependent receptor [Sandaracinaceae bacterium]
MAWLFLLALVFGAWAQGVEMARAQKAKGQASKPPEKAEEEALPVYRSRAEVPRTLEAIDPAAAVGRIELATRRRALETLDEALRELPGTRIQRSGAIGSPTFLSLRGADPEHTVVLINDIPLLAADGSATDLSMLPAWLFERIEVYRGGAPLWLGASPIGGALRLIPRQGVGRLQASFGMGSFGRTEGRLVAATGNRRMGVVGATGLGFAENSYPYLDDGGTAFVTTDDRERLRQNADLLEGHTLLHAWAGLWDGKAEVLGLLSQRKGGLPPPPARYVDTPLGRRSNERWLFALGWSGALGKGNRFSSTVGVAVEERKASDPTAEFGLVPRHARDRLLRLHLRTATESLIGTFFSLTALLSVGYERVESEDRLLLRLDTGRGEGQSERLSGGLGIEPRLFHKEGALSFEARLAGKLDFFGARIDDVEESRGPSEPRNPSGLLPQGRLSLSLLFEDWLKVVTSAQSGIRFPSSLELFGDRSYLAGNPALEPEQAIGADVGFFLLPRFPPLQAHLEVRAFWNEATNLIRYQRIAPNQILPLNIQSARIFGIEASARGELPWLRLEGTCTLLDARDLERNLPLPLRPDFIAFARLELLTPHPSPATEAMIFIELEHVASSTADPAALVRIPERTPIGLGASALFEKKVRMEFLVRDLFDVRGFDLLGLPLPGRSFSLLLGLEEAIGPADAPTLLR